MSLSIKRASATDYLRALNWQLPASEPGVHACNCVGPQDGEPVCPCRMSSIRIRHGRYVEIIDHGPAPAGDDSSD